MGPLAVNPIFLVNELVLSSLFLMEGYLPQPKYRGQGFGTASSDVSDFVESPWEASPSLRSG